MSKLNLRPEHGAAAKPRAWPLWIHIAALVFCIAAPALAVAGVVMWRLEAAERTWLVFAAASAALLSLTSLVALFFAHEMARPIRSLIRVAGSGGERTFPPSRLKEANELGLALAQTARRIRASESRFRTLAERARDIVLLLDVNGTIVEANAAAVKSYGYALSELIGQSVSMLREPGTRAEVGQQLMQAATRGTLFETLHVRKNGSVFPVEVSAAPARIADENYIFSIIRDISRRKHGEAALREREAMLQTVTQNVGLGLALLDMDRRYTFVNPAYSEWLQRSREDMLGKEMAEMLGPLYEEMREPLEEAYQGKQVSFELQETEKGEAREGEARTWQVTFQPARDALGRMSGLIVVMVDITGPKRDADQIRFLMRELSHRSKNLLAVIQAMARQTSRSSQGLADFEERFSARIMGLARSHDLLVQQNWQGVAIAELIRTQLHPFVDEFQGRVFLAGPLLMLQPDAANHLGLALHELATNASKYGALSTPRGKVEIAWETDPASRVFRITWRETGGPPVREPARRGFGRQVVEHIVATALSGAAHTEFTPDSVVWRLEAGLANVVLAPPDRKPRGAAARAAAALTTAGPSPIAELAHPKPMSEAP